MIKICPKCDYVFKPDDTGDPDVCPSCGLIISKYLAASAKVDAAKLGHRARPEADVKTVPRWLKMMVLVLFAAGALNLYLNHKRPAVAPYKPVNLPVLPAAATHLEQFEFASLFDQGTSLQSLTTSGHYTVVEVYLDQCTYCRELESALGQFQKVRKDIDLIRIHHPGHLNASVQASSQEELNQKMQAMNAKMESYQLCGSPHVEVYGPDREPLGMDTCRIRDGTSFVWNWITTETGIARHSKPGEFSPMS